MKATVSGLAAVLVSICALNTASAQAPYPAYQPYPVMPVGYAVPGVGHAAGGGCSTCNTGHSGLLGSLGLKSAIGHSAGCNGGCNQCGAGGLCAALKGWLCRPLPSTAPSCGGPLGFPQHPYVRSPRDYFMNDDP
jgi:hypothetical protein